MVQSDGNSDGSNLFSPQLITRKGPPFSTLLSSQLVENEKEKLFRERHLNYKLPSQRSTTNSMISKMSLPSLVKTKSPLRFSSRSQHRRYRHFGRRSHDKTVHFNPTPSSASDIPVHTHHCTNFLLKGNNNSGAAGPNHASCFASWTRK